MGGKKCADKTYAVTLNQKSRSVLRKSTCGWVCRMLHNKECFVNQYNFKVTLQKKAESVVPEGRGVASCSYYTIEFHGCCRVS